MSELIGNIKDKLFSRFSSKSISETESPSIVNNLDSDQDTPESIEAREQLNAYVDKGIQMLKEEDYATALRYFTNLDVNNQNLGVTLDRESRAMMIDIKKIDDLDDKIIDSYANSLATSGHFIPGTNTVKIASLHVYNLDNLEEVPPLELLPKKLLHEAALIAGEEWLHAKQSHNGPLTGEIDPEKDVALFYKQEGIEVTDGFMKREGRWELKKNE